MSYYPQLNRLTYLSLLVCLCLCLRRKMFFLLSLPAASRKKSDGGPQVIRMESFSLYCSSNDSPSSDVENHSEFVLTLK